MKDRSRKERNFPPRPETSEARREGAASTRMQSTEAKTKRTARRMPEEEGSRSGVPSGVRGERDFLERGERKPIRSRWEQMTTRALHVEGPSSGYRE